MALRIEHLPADVFGLSSLSRAALSGRPAPPDLGGMTVPAGVDAIPRPTPADEADRFQPDERAQLAATLEESLAPLGPPVQVLDNVRRLTQPGATVVVAGQQPGFLGGPLYDLYKALHAVRLAADLERSWGTPVVPLFWNHADDHDVAEVHHLHVVNPNLDLRKIALAGMSSGRRPVGDIVLTEEEHRLGPIAELLRQNLAPARDPADEAARDAAIEMFVPRPGETLARAFTRIFTDLLGPHGLVVMEPSWLRTGLSRELARVVACDPAPHGTIEALRQGASDLREGGHEPGIDPEGAALLFHHVEGRRQALRAGGDGFRYDQEPGSRTAVELAAEIVQTPADWSPGALLRPIVQDLVLPVAAYVGGWGELAYHAELGPLRDAVGAPRTPFVPRLSCTLVEPEVDTALGRLGAELQEVLRQRGNLGDEEDEEGAPVADDLRAAAGRAATELNELRGPLSELDPGLAVQLKKTAKQVTDLVGKLAGKADRVHANRAGKGRRHQRRVQSALAPREQPQERVLGTLPFVARYGRAWIDELLDEIEPFPSEHLVVHLTEETR